MNNCCTYCLSEIKTSFSEKCFTATFATLALFSLQPSDSLLRLAVFVECAASVDPKDLCVAVVTNYLMLDVAKALVDMWVA